MKLQIHAAVVMLCCAALFNTGCTDANTPDDDVGIGEITIFNIPAKINESGNESQDQAYKVYINASDYMDADKPHKTQGTAVLTEEAGATINEEKWEVTIPLYNPPSITNPKPDPDDHGDPWYGETAYFSVVISPKVADDAEDIWVKAGLTLNKGKARMDWEAINYDFKKLKDDPFSASFGFKDKQAALFTDVVCKDDAIQTP